MKSSVETLDAKEFKDLMKSMKELGFRPADVARMLNKSKGAISQYLSGYTAPNKTVLELLRRIFNEKRASAGQQNAEIEINRLSGVISEDECLLKKLADIRRASPSQFEAIKTTIEMLHKQLPIAAHASRITNPKTSKLGDGVKVVIPDNDSQPAKSLGKRIPKSSQILAAASEIEFECPNCKQRATTQEKNVGRKFQCPGCNRLIEVPKRFEHTHKITVGFL